MDKAKKTKMSTQRILKVFVALSLIFIIVFMVFSSVLRCSFVNWDDDRNIIDNTIIQSLTCKNIQKIFTSFFIGHYFPLTMLSYALEYHFFKLSPFPYHLNNLMLHLLNCLLVFWLFYLISGRISVSFIVAVLFGTHPLQVDTVAWVSERKNVLYAVFYLGALICYLYYLRNRFTSKYYYGTLLLFFISLLAKSMAIMLPIILLVVDVFLYKRKNWRILIEKIPFLFLSIVFTLIAVIGSHSIGIIRAESAFNVLHKIMIASYALIFYLYKLAIPGKLACFYYYSGIDSRLLFISFVSFMVFLAWIGIIIISRRYTNKIIFGSLFFFISSLPILQFIPTGEMIVANHYAYIPLLGVFYMIGEGILWISEKLQASRVIKIAFLVTLVVTMSVLGLISMERCIVWRDSITLWTDVITKYPYTATAYNNRGAALLANKEYKPAYIDFVTALHIDPNYCEAYFNLGSLHSQIGNDKEAVRFINKTLAINPGYLKAYDFLAILYGKMGNHREAIQICTKAIQIDPHYALGYSNLCSAYGNLGNYESAIKVGKKAIEIDPNLASAHFNLSIAYYYTKQFDLAIQHCDKATELGFKVIPEYLDEIKPYRR